MIQQLADHIDQLDLALDQLALKDRNFDRFAMMLIDNVVELVLHQYAKDKNGENEKQRHLVALKHDVKTVAAALGQHFDAKVKLARISDMFPSQVADGLTLLHKLRNSAHHRGLRHEGILHSLSLFYFRNACIVLTAYRPRYWMYRQQDEISHRALKYLGKLELFSAEEAFSSAWGRLRCVAESMGDSLVADLHSDMAQTIDRTDDAINFLTYNATNGMTRSEAVVEAQIWPFALSDEANSFTREHGCDSDSVREALNCLREKYPWPFKGDPIPSWQSRLASLLSEADPYLALGKYCSFMTQTEDVRARIEEAASQVDAQIQNDIDEARGR